MMNMVLFVPDQDSPGKKDMSAVFYPDARAFARHYGQEPSDVIVRFPANAPPDQRRAVCLQALRSVTAPLDVVAFFCHGWPDGLQAGFTRINALTLARVLGMHARLDAHVVLYACNAGRDRDADDADDLEPGPGGDGGYADELRDACGALGRRITVVAHSSAGHASYNPFCRYFDPTQGGKGGQWFVEPNSPLWPLWRRALRDPRSTLRWRFWDMRPSQIEQELMPPPLDVA
jgi:hypothetical protein